MSPIPVAVLELQRDDLVGPQTQASQDQQDSAVTQPDRRADVAAVDGALRVLGEIALGSCSVVVRGDGRHGRNQFASDIAAELRVPEGTNASRS